MEDILISLLESFKYPVRRQGSLGEAEEYPATFITFWSPSEESQSAYDNAVATLVYEYDVNVYSDAPGTTYSLLEEIKDLLETNGWQIPDRGHDLQSDEASHTGRGITVTFLKTK